MQLSVPWRYGQAKPFGSIPRLDWAHPLAKGLICYCYDAGGGVIIDLVSGKCGTHYVAGVPSTPAKVSSSKYGGGWQYSLLTSGSTADAVSFPANSRIDTAFSTAPLTVACGVTQTAANLSGLLGIYGSIAGSGAGTSWGGIGNDGSGNPSLAFFNSFGPNFTTNRAIVNGAFTTIVVAQTTTTLANLYYLDSTGYVQINNGVSNSGLGSTSGLFVTINDSFASSSAVAGHRCNSNGFVHYYAIWKNRALSQSEVRHLANDPWCFLVYPEDEIFSTLVGAAAAVALPDAPAERIPWILPGLGPASRHVSLLNAGLPAQPVVQPVAGGTLPFMGVGG